MHAVRKGEPGYPRRLMRYEKMPETLYYIGKLPDENRRTAAVIGARACSPYGRIQAFRYADFLSRAGVQVISGLAYGIDSEGHKGALEGPTPTFAVLGSGADVCYPKGHLDALRADRLESGRHPFSVCARNHAAALAFSPEKCDHQRPVRHHSHCGGA